MNEPQISRVLETALYVDDLDRAETFYRDALGLKVLSSVARLVAMDAGHATVLLLFRRGATTEGADTAGGRIPPHDGSGPAHVAFAVPAEELPAWEKRLADRGIPVESRVKWGRGGESVYFRDPDGHSVELATPGVWRTY